MSEVHKTVLKEIAETGPVSHSRWVKASRAGGDPNPRAFLYLAEKRLIRAIDVETWPSIRQSQAEGRARPIVVNTITTYQITEKGKQVLKNI
tara:strand:- start:12546 stop:12821 length:276 start_codon:yes stop_codon:yes gene_type:complete